MQADERRTATVLVTGVLVMLVAAVPANAQVDVSALDFVTDWLTAIFNIITSAWLRVIGGIVAVWAVVKWWTSRGQEGSSIFVKIFLGVITYEIVVAFLDARFGGGV